MLTGRVRHNTRVTLPVRLGRLRRVDRIGAGGFATVWLYHDDDLDSPVAVKALADNWAQRLDVRERFLEEARMLRRADSEHVVRVYDIGEVDQTPYFVMSYADRGSLATVTDVGAIDPLRAVDLIAQAGAGVSMLHRRGIIHRDIKPQNLLLRTSDDEADEVLVADLGVAKAMLHASGLTQVVGTPAYMAPEQASGLGVDARADVHALAAVAYHLMTGRTARQGGIAELAAPTLPPRPSEIDPALAPYDEALLRGLEPHPEDRWPDVLSFIGALQSVARAQQATTATVLEAPPAQPPPAPARSRRKPLLIGAAAVVVAAAVGTTLALVNPFAGKGEGPTAGPTNSPSPTLAPIIQPDIDWPTLGTSLRLTQKHSLAAPSGTTWTYAVPAGWTATVLDDAGQLLPTATPTSADDRTEVRWHPKDEPVIGGYSLRFRALDPVQTPLEMRIQRVALLRHAHYEGFKIYRQTPQAIWFTFIDAAHHLRYNFWRWVPNPKASGKAGLEISVSGRKRDVPGLDALITAAAKAAHPD